MAINKTAAGTFVVDFRDQSGKRIRKTFPTYKRASDYDKEAVAQVSRGDFILPSRISLKSGTRGRRRPARTAFACDLGSDNIVYSIGAPPVASALPDSQMCAAAVMPL
jgi:hypothetical protein